MFRTQFDSHERIYSHPGARYKVLYSPVVDEFGHIDLEETGQEDLYEYIQSHAQSVDINVIIARYNRGDTEALQRVQGTYADVTNLPKTYAELLNTVIQGETAFMSLPLEVRARFNHSYYEWMASMDDYQGFAEKMGFKMPDVDVVAGDQEAHAIKDAISSPQPASGPEDSNTSPSPSTPSQ
ncbi:internal scaffolding protein [Peromfec virus RodF8_33]|uniref:Internal scaffolding protein n=1 Tax=Peromfec virus RodF8_33 TaxID=2929370 RepID=A0A976N2G9_9VIRU|nr:internal scaffolding protein [Peromfec virus RodF8_33]